MCCNKEENIADFVDGRRADIEDTKRIADQRVVSNADKSFIKLFVNGLAGGAGVGSPRKGRRLKHGTGHVRCALQNIQE